MVSAKVRYELRDSVAVITMDDGKANALSHEMIDGLQACLDTGEREARAVVLTGRDKRFCAGFDLNAMTSSHEAARQLVTAGAELLVRLYTFPRPVVLACTGHALAAGSLFLFAADVRIGVRGDFKIGLNEVSIHMTLPIFALEMARDRLSKRHFTSAVTQARIFDPDTAKDAGFFDQVEAPEALLSTALDRARRLAELPEASFRITKERERAATVKLIRDTLTADMAQLTSPR